MFCVLTESWALIIFLRMKNLFLFTFTCLFSILTFAVPVSLQGEDLVTGKKILVSAEKKKPMIVVFMSSTCPCSNSHVDELKDLHKTFSDKFNFVVIHSNADEPKIESKPYFDKAQFSFPVIEDSQSKVADQFKAQKTPHAFIVLADGHLAYAGGMTDSHDCNRAEKKYLREALIDLAAGRPVRISEARALGCMISRPR